MAALGGGKGRPANEAANRGTANGPAEFILYSPVTAPLLEPQDFEELITAFRTADPHKYDAAAFALQHQGHFYFNGAPLNFDPSNTMATQQAPPLLEIPYSAAIIGRHTLYDARTVLGGMPGGPLLLTKKLSQIWEVDDCADFQLAQILYEKRHGPPPKTRLPQLQQSISSSVPYSRLQPSLSSSWKPRYEPISAEFQAGTTTNTYRIVLRDVPPPLGAAPRPGGGIPVAGQVEAFCVLNICDFAAWSDLMAWAYGQTPRFSPDEVAATQVVTKDQALELVKKGRDLPLWLDIETMDVEAEIEAIRRIILTHEADVLLRLRTNSTIHAGVGGALENVSCHAVNIRRLERFGFNLQMHLDAVTRGEAGDAQWVTRTVDLKSETTPDNWVTDEAWEYIAMPWCGETGLRRNLHIAASITKAVKARIPLNSQGGDQGPEDSRGITRGRTNNDKEIRQQSVQFARGERSFVNPANRKMKMGGSCAVVGSSGSLRGSMQGKTIDAHDIVIRFNYAPTTGYEEDVGMRTDFRFIRLSEECDILAHLERVMPQEQDSILLAMPDQDLSLAAMVLGDAYAHANVTASPALRKRLRVLSFQTQLHHLRGWINFFGDNPARAAGEGTLQMAGTTGVLWALQHCSSVDAFGFGFPTNPGRPKWYYDAVGACFQRKTTQTFAHGQDRLDNIYAHDYEFEHRLMTDLHDHGVIRRF